MRFYADLHLHSKFSRATARNCDLPNLAYWARKKGIAVLGTGDFTHPGWMNELKQNLVSQEGGLFRLGRQAEEEIEEKLPGPCRGSVRFMLSVEISTIYKKGERTRKVHHVVYVPDFESAGRFTAKLARVGNLASDGRPILGLDSRDLLEMVLESGPGCFLVPAHIWTPWFSALGSKSGFDSIDACYGDLGSHIFAVETGLSSDPEMNWRVASLDRFRLVSNSDAHSPAMLGREACVFDCEMDFFAMRRALEQGAGYVGTVEFFPEEGKYHLDGHRKCGVRLQPEQTRQLGGRCPECGGLITVGVMSRVQQLAETAEREPPDTAGKVQSLVPLPEVLSEILGVGAKSKRVCEQYERLVARLGPELCLLTEVPLEEIERAGSALLGEAVARLRQGRVLRQAGYDGEYGVIRLFQRDELGRRTRGGLLFEDTYGGESATQGKPKREVGGVEDRKSKKARPENSADAVGRAQKVRQPTTDNRRPAKAEGAVRGVQKIRQPTTDNRQPAKAEGAVRGVQKIRQPTTDNRQPLTDNRQPELGGILQGLDQEQRAAAEAIEGPVLIVAGPGSGKTRTLTHRMAHLVAERGIEADRCLAITFTRRAANEMRQRLRVLVPERWEAFAVFTFHALGLSLLQQYRGRVGLQAGFRVADEAQRLQLLAECMGTSEREARRLLGDISLVKRSGRQAREAEVLVAYEREMRQRGLLDFDDLVGLSVGLLERSSEIRDDLRRRYGWISIDEYQDIDAGQYRLVKLLAPAGANVCAIGDPDQAIYGFRGSDVRFFNRFVEDYPGARVFRLKKNYRSGRNIVEASAQVMARQQGERTALQALLDSPDKIVIHEAASEKAEAEFVVQAIEQLIGGHSFFSLDSGRSDRSGQMELCFADLAVLYRTEVQAEALREALARSGIPFQVRSHERLSRQPGVQTVLRWLRQGGAEGTVRSRLEYAGQRAIQETKGQDDGAAESIETALHLLAPLADGCGDDLERFESEIVLGEQVDTWDSRADRVSLLTLHAAKGLQFAVVFIVGCEQGILPLLWGEAEPSQIEEERRLFYVGMTRARERLFLCRAKKRRWQGKVRPRQASEFLRDIQERLLERRKARPPGKRRPDPDEQLTLF